MWWDKEEEKEEITNKIPILMMNSFKDKVDWLSKEYDKEVAGWIVGDITNKGIILKELLIPEQESGSASVDMTPKNLIKLRKQYGDKCAKIIGEFHSHARMGVSWSSTDEEFMEQFSEPRDICVFVVSSLGEHLIRVEIRKPFKLSLDNLPYFVEKAENPRLKEELEKEIKDKITLPQVTQSGVSGVYSGYDGGYYGNYKPQEEQKTLAKEKTSEYSRRVKFYPNTNIFSVFEIPPYYMEILLSDFRHLKVTTTKNNNDTYNINFNFSSREEFKENISDIGNAVKSIITEEFGGGVY